MIIAAVSMLQQPADARRRAFCNVFKVVARGKFQRRGDALGAEAGGDGLRCAAHRFESVSYTHLAFSALARVSMASVAEGAICAALRDICSIFFYLQVVLFLRIFRQMMENSCLARKFYLFSRQNGHIFASETLFRPKTTL